jgi:hypothetical protein
LHIHNVFPYFLIKLNKTVQNRVELNEYARELSNEIDKILNIAFCIRDTLNSQHVYAIEPVMTKSMYGYHEKDSIFLKISVINPNIINKYCTCLNSLICGLLYFQDIHKLS